MVRGNVGAKKPRHAPEKERRVRDESDEEVGVETPGAVEQVDEVEESTEKAFRKNLTKLLKYLVLTSKAWEHMEKENVDRAIRRTRQLEEFQKEAESIDYRFLALPFIRLLRKHYNSISHGPGYDAWLREVETKKGDRDPRVVLDFPRAGNRNAAAHKLRLSTLYLDAHEVMYDAQMKLDASKESEDVVDELYATMEQLVYPNSIRLYLWRIFAILAAEQKSYGKAAAAKIRSTLETLEMDLGIAHGGDIFRRFMRLMLDDDEGPLAEFIEWGSAAMKKIFPPSMHKSYESFVELLKRYANNELEFEELLQQAVEKFSDATGLRKHAEGEKVVGELRETVTSALGGLAKKDGKTLGPVEMFQKVAQLFNAAKKSTFLQAKVKEMQAEFGEIHSLEDAKKINPLHLLQLARREVNNKEFIQEMEHITGQNLQHSEMLQMFEKVAKVYEAIVEIMAGEDAGTGAEPSRRVRAITDGTVVGEAA